MDTVGELQQVGPGGSIGGRHEPVRMGEFSDTTWLLILPAGTLLDTGDAVIVDGLEYELEGDPWAIRNPRTGVASHIEATLTRAAGAEDVS